MKIQTKQAAGRLFLDILGNIDFYSIPTLKDHLLNFEKASVTSCVIGLASVDFIDSSGIGALLEARRLAKQHDTDLYFLGIKDEVRNLLMMARVDGLLQLVDSLGEIEPVSHSH